ncbi:MAG TPA: hypothetical protein VHS08_06150 [Candidatus Acidoferrales bacterium]|nr:hypothetical protein [Candidatus Acidoferrales bacterium]
MGDSTLKFTSGLREPEIKSTKLGQSPRSIGARQDSVLDERIFHSMLTMERRRAERSRKPYVLMLIDANLESGASETILKEAINVILAVKRETDVVGWYRVGAILGVIFTEVSVEGKLPVTETLRTKVATALIKNMGADRSSRIAISMHTEG